MAVTRAAITRTDNETVLRWSRQASVNENRAVTVAEILARLVLAHKRSSGDEPPKPTEGISEQIQND